MSESLNSKYEIGKVYPINVNELQPNPEQPRKYFDEDEIKALAADIEANGLLQNIIFLCHIVVADYVDQLDSAVGYLVQFVDHALIIFDHILVKLINVRVAGIIDRQKPLIQKITVDHQFPHISCALQAL